MILSMNPDWDWMLEDCGESLTEKSYENEKDDGRSTKLTKRFDGYSTFFSTGVSTWPVGQSLPLF